MHEIHPVTKVLVIFGIVLIILGLIWQLGGRFYHLGRLPGDIVIKRENFQFYFPVVSSILLSIVFSIAGYLFRRFFN